MPKTQTPERVEQRPERVAVTKMVTLERADGHQTELQPGEHRSSDDPVTRVEGVETEALPAPEGRDTEGLEAARLRREEAAAEASAANYHVVTDDRLDTGTGKGEPQFARPADSDRAEENDK